MRPGDQYECFCDSFPAGHDPDEHGDGVGFYYGDGDTCTICQKYIRDERLAGRVWVPPSVRMHVHAYTLPPDWTVNKPKTKVELIDKRRMS